jgi:hypothetical protein
VKCSLMGVCEWVWVQAIDVPIDYAEKTPIHKSNADTVTPKSDKGGIPKKGDNKNTYIKDKSDTSKQSKCARVIGVPISVLYLFYYSCRSFCLLTFMQLLLSPSFMRTSWQP